MTDFVTDSFSVWEDMRSPLLKATPRASKDATPAVRVHSKKANIHNKMLKPIASLDDNAEHTSFF